MPRYRTISDKNRIFVDKNHTQNILQRMRESIEFDVILIAGNTEELKIPVHRFVLSASTDYFKTMFTPPYSESTAREVKLSHVDGEILKSLVEFFYSGRLEIRKDNVEKLIVAADSLLLDAVVSACSYYLSRLLDSRNCLHFIQLAERHNFVSLLKNSKEYCLQNFVKVYSTDEFLDLNVDLLQQLLASDYLCETNLFKCHYENMDYINPEQHVFSSLMRWLQHDPLEREQYKDELLKLVRMPLLERSFLINSVQPVCTSTVSQRLIAKAIKWHSLSESTKLNVKLAKPRKRMNQNLMAITGTSELDIFLHEIDNSWMLFGTKLKNRLDFDVAVQDDDLFIVGGANKHANPLNTVICLNLPTMTVRDVKPMHERRRDVSVAALKGFLYAVGGHDGENCLNTVERYDKETNVWSEVAPMLNRRQKFSVAILNEKLYVVGGRNDSGRLKLAECYDPQQNAWTKIASVGKEACYTSSVTVAGGILYLVGGGRNCKVFQMYDPKENKWVMLCRLPVENLIASIWTFEDTVMALDEHSDKLNFLEFDPSENKWKKNNNIDYQKNDACNLEDAPRIFSYNGEIDEKKFSSMERNC